MRRASIPRRSFARRWRLARTFDDQETKTAPGVIGIRGTGWFLVFGSHQRTSPRPCICRTTIGRRSSFESGRAKGRFSFAFCVLRVQLGEDCRARIEGLVSGCDRTSHPDRAACCGGACLPSLAYPHGQLRFARGRFVRFGEGDALLGAAFLEMHDGNDRLVLDHGASGAPVLDCEGRVVAVVSTAIARDGGALPVRCGAQPRRRGRPPNVVSIPAEVLKDFLLARLSAAA